MLEHVKGHLVTSLMLTGTKQVGTFRKFNSRHFILRIQFAELQIRGGIEDNSEIIFLISQ